jgi:uncharacterized membrane protein YhhN
MYRWLILSLVAFILAHWGYLSLNTKDLPDWGVAGQLIVETCLAEVLLAIFLTEFERLQPLLLKLGWDVQITWCKI